MLTVKTKTRLVNALTRKTLADEMEAKMITAAPLSVRLKRAIEVAMASKAAAKSVIDAIETGGAQSISVDAKSRSVEMMAQKVAGNELIATVTAAN